MWAGWLSSTYVLSDSGISASTQVTNTIYKKKQTNFIKDIIFKSNLADSNDNLLLNEFNQVEKFHNAKQSFEKTNCYQSR